LAEFVNCPCVTRPLLQKAFQICVPLLTFEVEGMPARMLLIQFLSRELPIALVYALF
jgi:hypothetical protein